MNSLSLLSRSLQKDFAELSRFGKQDLIAGFQVFLIALPLCLGISIASGFPAMSGLIAAIVGGLLVSRFSGSHVTINGPAAGLIVVILDSVQRLGHGDTVLGYKYTLAAIVCAGLIQVVFGLLRVGRWSAIFPVSAVHGMLTAIGLIIMAKQAHVLLGVKVSSGGIIESILAHPSSFRHLNPVVAMIGGSSLLLLILHKRLNYRWFQILPGPLWAIGAGILLAKLLHLGQSQSYVFAGQSYELGPQFLLQLSSPFWQSLTLPLFQGVAPSQFLVSVLSIALIASLETILSTMAVDKLDPEQRKSDLNRDILAVGLGTTVSGLLGGLPMIAEIVRSSANVTSGAKTQWSNFFHGLFLLIFVLMAPQLLNQIPLSSLAALLIMTGFRLASPQEFRRMRTIGWDQLSVFLTTIVMTLATDLLLGIASGILLKILIHVSRIFPLHSLVKAQFWIDEREGQYQVRVRGPLIFTNYVTLTSRLDLLSRDSRVVLWLDEASYVDHTVMEYLHQLERDFAKSGGHFSIEGHEDHHKYSVHPLSARRLKSESFVP